jgi:hypothetical protein
MMKFIFVCCKNAQTNFSWQKRKTDQSIFRTKAAELAIKFLDSDKAIDVATTAGPLLVEVGAHNAAAQLYMGVEMIRLIFIGLCDLDLSH